MLWDNPSIILGISDADHHQWVVHSRDRSEIVIFGSGSGRDETNHGCAKVAASPFEGFGDILQFVADLVLQATV